MRTLARFLSRGLILLAILVPVQALAQTGAASLTGIVTDQSGAAVPGATVTATNQATNVEYTAISNDAGNYNVTSLPVGAYVVKAELSRFKTAATKPIQMEAKQVVRLDFKLELGALPRPSKSPARRRCCRPRRRRSVRSSPGRPSTTCRSTAATPASSRCCCRAPCRRIRARSPAIRNFGGGRPYVNGNREQTNNYTIDGVDMNESIDNLVAYQPSPDALAQISVETNNYAADTGNVAGAVISNVLKSGSNQFHGNAFEYYRNSSMDANSWSNNRSGAAKPKRRQDIYGGTLGGPLMKNKLFFFGNYQGTRNDAPGFETVSVAPASWRQRRSVAPDQRPQGSGHGRRRSPATRFRPAGSVRLPQRILNNLALYPLPNRTVPGGITGNYVGETLTTIRAKQGDGRVDWSPSQQRQDLRTLLDRRIRVPERQARVSAAARQPHDGTVPQPGASTGTASSTPSLVNEVLVRLQPDHDRQRHAGLGGHRRRERHVRYCRRPADRRAQLDRVGQRADLGRRGRQRHQHRRQDLSDQREAHVAEGAPLGEVRRPVAALRASSGSMPATTGCSGIFGYTGAFSGAPFSDFLLDQVGSKGRGSLADPWTHLHNRSALYVQDDFKVTPALTLNLGMRWAYTQPVVEKDNRQGNFDLTTGQEILAQDGSSREPRALQGLQERVRAAPRRRVAAHPRGGSCAAPTASRSTWRAPAPTCGCRSTRRSSSSRRSATTRPAGPGTLTTGFAELKPLDQPSGQVRAWDPNLRPQFTQQWNVFVERLVTQHRCPRTSDTSGTTRRTW